MLYQGVTQGKANDLTVDNGCILPRRKSRPLGLSLGQSGGESPYRKHRCAIRIERAVRDVWEVDPKTRARQYRHMSYKLRRVLNIYE